MADQRRNLKNKDSQLFKSLTRLFSGPLVNFRQQAQLRFRRRDLNKFNFNSVSGKQFQKTSYNPFEAIQANILANQTRAERYSDFDQMEFSPELACITGDTEVYTLEGVFSINQLMEKYPNGESFEVWSWDNEKCQYTIGAARAVRKTGTKNIVQVNIDNGEYLKCTPDHRILMKDGTYKQAKDLLPGDAIMPFDYKFNSDGYLKIRTKNYGKYKQVHRYIYEDIFENNLGINNVHHINEVKTDNRTCNLQVMTPLEHIKHHGISFTTNKKREKTSKELWNNEEYREAALSGLRRWQSSKEGKLFMSEHTAAINKKRWKNDIHYVRKMTEIFSENAKKLWQNKEWAKWKREHHSKTIILKYKNDPSYKEKVARHKNENGRYVNVISTESILLEGQKYETLVDLARNFDFGDRNFTKEIYKVQFINRRLREAGYQGWQDYKLRYVYNNHKIVNVVDLNEQQDVYDLTVDHFENFCLKNGMIISNSALDMYADEITTHSSVTKMLQVKSSNQEIRGILEHLYYDVLNVEFNLYGWCRTMCKFGDMFLYLDIDPELGVKNVIGLPSPEIERLEGQDKTNPNYVQFQWNSGGLTFESWQIGHFRILGQDKYAPYGTSVLEGARRIWRQLNLLEDAMMAYRIVRAPDRRVFYIDVGNIAPDDVEQFMLRIQNQMKRNMIVDPQTGRVDLRYNPMSIDEDYYIPTRGQSATKIDTLAGGNFVGDIDDVQYLRDKLFTAIKIPQAYLTSGKDAVEDKTTLAQKDVRFARTIQRLQRVVVAELEKIGIIHLFTLGYRNEDLLNFSLSLNNPSRISELQELEHWKTKFDVAGQAKEGFFSKRWIAENIFNLSEQDYRRIQRELYSDKLFEAALEAAGQADAAGAEAGGDLGGGGGGMPDLGGGGGGEEPAPEEAAPEGGEEAGGPVPVDQLPPARRRDNGYKHVSVDRRESKGRKHSMNSNAIPEGGLGATSRTMFPGYDNLKSLTRLSESVNPDENEIKLHEVNSDIKNLLTSLEKMDANKTRKA